MKVPKPRKLPSGTWFINLRLGGANIPVSADTEKACRDKAALIKAEHNAGKKRIAKSELTLREALSRHIEKKEKAARSPETIRSYEVIKENRFQSAMDKRVSTINNWQELYDIDASHLSAKTMSNTWMLIKSACKSECGIELPEIEVKEIKRKGRPFLEPEEITAFVKAIKGSKYEIPMLLELSSCRASEVSGLDWKDVDLKNNRIYINGAIVRDKDNKYVEKTDNKTAESTRYVPIFIPELKAALEAVPDKTGKVVKARANTIYRNVNRICEGAGLPTIGNHGLRHSFASLCYSLGVPIKITMQIGGWSDYNTVMKIYTHLSKRDVGKYTQDLTNFFAEKNESEDNNVNEIVNKLPRPL